MAGAVPRATGAADDAGTGAVTGGVAEAVAEVLADARVRSFTFHLTHPDAGDVIGSNAAGVDTDVFGLYVSAYQDAPARPYRRLRRLRPVAVSDR
jgi:hypothetical protein